MSVEQEHVLTVPRSLKRFGTKEELRDYLGELIHALRSHIPCVYLHEGDEMWCEKVVPCLRRAYRWCHLHGCHSRGRCEDPNCPYAWKLISHWYNCHSDLCFVCSPWVKPSSLYGQSKDFLAEIFGEKPLIKAFADLLTPPVYRSCEPMVETNESVTDDEKDDGRSTDFEVDIRSSKICVSLGVQADLRAAEVNKVPIHRKNVRKGFCMRHHSRKSKKTSENAVFVIAEKDGSNQIKKWDVSIQVDLPVRSKSEVWPYDITGTIMEMYKFSVKPGASGCQC